MTIAGRLPAIDSDWLAIIDATPSEIEADGRIGPSQAELQRQTQLSGQTKGALRRPARNLDRRPETLLAGAMIADGSGL